jgi:hypothetical protein
MQASTTILSTAATPGIRGRYQDPETTMTLREGLAEYYQVNPGLSNPANITNEKSTAYFRNHDTTHVVFGTNTAILDEAVNDMLTIFGVDIRLRDYFWGFFATDEAKTIAKEFRVVPVLSALWHTARLMPKIWRHSRAMTKKWPWAAPGALMDRPLREIREEYGIELFRPEVALEPEREPAR